MSCAEFCAIISCIGTVFLTILGIVVASGTKFIDWKIRETRDMTQNSLFIAAGLYFGFFVAAIAYKTVRDKRIENEEQSHKMGRNRLVSEEEEQNAPAAAGTPGNGLRQNTNSFSIN